MNILLSTPACLTRIAKCWHSQLLSIFLGITHLFSNQVCKSGIAYPLLVRRKVFSKNTADFHGDGYFLQNAGFTKGLRIAFVVCDVNSEYRRIQVNSADFEAFLPHVNGKYFSIFFGN